MRNRSLRVQLCLCLFLVLGACSPRSESVVATPSVEGQEAEEPRKKLLRVGVTPESPPLIFKMGADIAGVEADFAKRLAGELGRSVRFVEVAWGDQIPALLEGRTDIIMSGMSVTEPRKIRIAFSKPYFKTSLFALVRNVDAYKYPTRQNIIMTDGDVGVQRDTTGDVFVQKNLPYARRWPFSTPRDGAFDLTNKKIDLFVHDGPVVGWLASENEATLTVLGFPLSQEIYAWGIRRDAQEFLESVNGILDAWKEDGTLDEVLQRWMPYLKERK